VKLACILRNLLSREQAREGISAAGAGLFDFLEAVQGRHVHIGEPFARFPSTPTSTMPLSRISRRLRACVLAWLLLAMAVAVAAPLLHDGPLQLVCSGSGQMKLLQTGDARPDGSGSNAGLDCPNCLLMGPLPGPMPLCAEPVPGVAVAVEHALHSPHVFQATPPPARAPPLNSTSI
jgi:hypothetical protein